VRRRRRNYAPPVANSWPRHWCQSVCSIANVGSTSTTQMFVFVPTHDTSSVDGLVSSVDKIISTCIVQRHTMTRCFTASAELLVVLLTRSCTPWSVFSGTTSMKQIFCLLTLVAGTNHSLQVQTILLNTWQ